MTQVALHFGALAPSLGKQLAKQGLRPEASSLYSSKELAKAWEKDADAISRLYLRGLLPDAEVKKARQRLLKVIVNGVEAKAKVPS